ncbi:ATP-binding cassette domain-containing protein [Amnibacterium setariae]|uniref:ATP-binding cassette domain-containing protein n=1 Tax=Amnibacterium setariae TaxID=2306585 RepID=A0A3A1U2S5_9MICO|nr:ATP-binding cassette domain-containing protein [Amnibacterium setariae]RIX28157.1 ATP-binding cassette domain-containing protein [Amnibacterium setariae]
MLDSDAAIVTRDLTVGYPGPVRFDAVRGLDLVVRPGELVGVVGETGAGKSTLARVLAGRAARKAGERGPRVVGGSVSVLGLRAERPGRAASRVLGTQVGYLPQHAGRTLTPGLTVAENVTQPLFEHDRRFDRREAGARAAELVDAVQLPLGILSRYPWELSAGQRQRVAIARSLVLRPNLWIADEPTSSVDVATRGPVLDTLLELHAERVFSAVIVSHDAAVMHRTTHRVVVLHRGVMIAAGTAESVLADPIHPYVRGLRDDYFLRTGAISVPAGR